MTDLQKKLFAYVRSLELSDVKERQLDVLIEDIMNEAYQIGWNDAVDEGIGAPKFKQPYKSDGFQGILGI